MELFVDVVDRFVWAKDPRRVVSGRSGGSRLEMNR